MLQLPNTIPAKIIFSVGPVFGSSLTTFSITFGVGQSTLILTELPKVFIMVQSNEVGSLDPSGHCRDSIQAV